MTKQTVKHTPGPWRERVGFEWLGIEAVKNSVLIAEMHNNSTLSKQEIIANANLVAAAPELLDACNHAWDYLKDNGVVISTPLMVALSQAIAKAEGKV